MVKCSAVNQSEIQIGAQTRKHECAHARSHRAELPFTMSRAQF